MMKTHGLLIVSLSMLVSMSMLVAACGESSTPARDAGAADRGTPGDGSLPTATFKAVVKDNLTKTVIPKAKVEILDFATGQLTGQTVTADKDGNIEIQLPRDQKEFSFKVSNVDYKDTYQFHIGWDIQPETLWAVSVTGFNGAATLAGFVPDKAKGVVAGAVYFKKDGKEEYVGCAVISLDPETTPPAEYRYFGDTGFPAPLDKVSSTNAGRGEGRFVAGNVPPGLHKLVTKLKGQTEAIGSAELRAFPDSLSVTNIYVTTPTNPTPDTCP
jgi:hypothetical protein